MIFSLFILENHCRDLWQWLFIENFEVTTFSTVFLVDFEQIKFVQKLYFHMPSKTLPVQWQQWKLYMFKNSNKDTKTTYWPYFKPFSSVSICWLWTGKCLLGGRVYEKILDMSLASNSSVCIVLHVLLRVRHKENKNIYKTWKYLKLKKGSCLIFKTKNISRSKW